MQGEVRKGGVELTKFTGVIAYRYNEYSCGRSYKNLCNSELVLHKWQSERERGCILLPFFDFSRITTATAKYLFTDLICER